MKLSIKQFMSSGTGDGHGNHDGLHSGIEPESAGQNDH